jgi:hypothetical protein
VDRTFPITNLRHDLLCTLRITGSIPNRHQNPILRENCVMGYDFAPKKEIISTDVCGTVNCKVCRSAIAL